MGDAREAQKNALYADMAKECAMEFGAIVLYTYGGFHASALTFIQRMAKAVDPATCLTSPSRWRRELMEQMAITVQRGNADIMITAAQRMRGKVWSSRRRLYSALRPSVSSRSSRRERRRARRNEEASDSDAQRQLLPHSGRAMTCVARLIGLSDHEAVCRGLGCSSVDSDADTEVEDEDGSPLSSLSSSLSSSLPSFIAETPLSSDSGREERVQTNALQEGETGECSGANDIVRAEAVGSHREAVQKNCTIGAVAVAVAPAVAAAVVSGDGMELEEEAVVNAVCAVMEECVDGGEREREMEVVQRVALACDCVP